ncbi:MAG: hypothetical protein EZS28_033135 [Streblomastix strix]|uniref:HAT C-terminal dimerisation domain-containing protein n=1 Tax=Streblomastix strix TaxID=222440 RepID=A0A5J4ULE8_9EUKA|nr:MAG: hypothetical protein EZS28_033135 [Streblomastix strix]
MNFQQEAYEFFAGKYSGIDDQLLLINPPLYWKSVNQIDLMKKSFSEFNQGILSMPASEADAERLFSKAKRVIGNPGQHTSLQTIFTRLV